MTASAEDRAAHPPLFGLRDRTLRLKGWRLFAAAFGAGAFGALGQAPLFLWPASLFAVVFLVWLLDGVSWGEGRRPLASAFARAYVFGVGQFLAGMWWVSNAFIQRGDGFGAFAWLGALGLAFGLALFWGAGGAICAIFWRTRVSKTEAGGPTWRRVVVFALVFSLVEFLRGTVLTGLPWNLPGYVWPAGEPISQAAAIIGVYGLSALTLFAFAAPAALAGPDVRPAARALPAATGLLIFAILFGLGLNRLTGAQADYEPGVRLRLVQVQMSQSEKWSPEGRDEAIRRYLDLTASPGLEEVTHVVWPEGALPIFLLDEPRVMDAIAEVLSPGQILLAGTPRRDTTDPLNVRYFNSLAAIDVSAGFASPIALYDKYKLVPFGETMPFPDLVRRLGIKALSEIADQGFAAGPGAATLFIPGAPALGPQICYEIIFPRFSTRGEDRPNWILNVSNDSWYGQKTSGPRQHFNQVRYRAIEEGLAVVRAASGGISGVVDPFGRVDASLSIEEQAALDVSLPTAKSPTIYARLGEIPFFIMIAFFIFAIVARPGRK